MLNNFLERVDLTFVNKKGQLKKVHFKLDHLTVEMTKKLSLEERQAYLLECYREYVAEQHYVRKNVSLDSYYDKNEEFELADETDFEKNQYNRMFTNEILNFLEETERNIIIKLFWENYTNVKLAAELGVSETTIRRRKDAILAKIRDKYCQ